MKGTRRGGRTMMATAAGMALALFAQAALAPVVARQDVPLPRLRQPDPTLLQTRTRPPKRLRFVLPDDMPPFAFRNRNGALTGLSVAIAQSLCRRAKVRCEYVVRPQAQLKQVLTRGEADVILAGLRPLAVHWRDLDFTRPYFRALGRFAVRRAAQITSARQQTLAGRRIAVVRGTLHEAYLKRHLVAVRLHLFKDFAAAGAALKEGRVDALFGDWLQLAFWVHGKAADGCCRMLPEVFAARLFAYNHHAMTLPAGRRELRDFLDRQLDRLQEDGELQLLARRFLPLHLQPREKRQ